MRLIFQASALLLAIAVFPLPINTGIALSTSTLSDIISEASSANSSHTASAEQPGEGARATLTEKRATPPSASPVATPASQLSLAASPGPNVTAASINADNDVIIVQTDITGRKAATTSQESEAVAEEGQEALTRTKPIKPQAVIATDFEQNGLSEATFRTMARLNTAEAPPEEKILVIGDSLSIPLGKQLESYFAQMPGIHFKRMGKVSSGLARPDFFDWEKNLATLAASMQPSTVVIMIGTNDNQTLKRQDGSSVHFSDTAWGDEYSRRIDRLFAILSKQNPYVQVFWVGAPIMQRSDLARDVKRINTTISDFCGDSERCHFIDTWDVLADDKGRFTDYLVDNTGERVRIRAGDGVHLSHSGARILADRALQAMTPNVAVMQARAALEPSG